MRIQHDPGRHDDRCVAIGMAAVPLVRRSIGGGRLHVPQGDLPPVRLVRERGYVAEHDAPAVVRPGEERPTDALHSFAAARRHKRYSPPGSWRTP